MLLCMIQLEGYSLRYSKRVRPQGRLNTKGYCGGCGCSVYHRRHRRLHRGRHYHHHHRQSSIIIHHHHHHRHNQSSPLSSSSIIHHHPSSSSSSSSIIIITTISIISLNLGVRQLLLGRRCGHILRPSVATTHWRVTFPPTIIIIITIIIQ